MENILPILMGLCVLVVELLFLRHEAARAVEEAFPVRIEKCLGRR